MLAKVDVDDFPDLAMKYKVNKTIISIIAKLKRIFNQLNNILFQINVVPSVIMFKNGKEVNRFQGNIDDDLLTHFITKDIKQ